MKRFIQLATRFIRPALALGLVAFTLVLTGCSTVPVTGRSQLNLMSSGEEMKLGLTSFEQIKKETKISTDPTANALVQKVGKRIAAVAGPDIPNAQWEFVVFDSKEAKAYLTMCEHWQSVGILGGLLFRNPLHGVIEPTLSVFNLPRQRYVVMWF